MAANTGRPAKMKPGPEALWDWMERRGLNQAEAAQLLHVHHVSLNQILMGRRRPGLAIAMRIERHTGINPGLWLRTTVRDLRDEPLALGRKRQA